MSRESAGAAIRQLREARDWSLADLAEASGVSVMGLSFLERGARKPHKSTVQKVENGLGLPPGSYARLLAAADAQSEASQLTASGSPPGTHVAAAVTADPGTDIAVLVGYAEAQLETLNSVIARLPAPSSNEYENVVTSVLAQCVKAEQLTANSWRVAVNTGGESASALLSHLRALEATRQSLLTRLAGSVGAQLDRACRESNLPEVMVCALLGVVPAQLWEIRNGGAIAPNVLRRVRAFVDAAPGSGQ
ncbi:helix-turn-helix domain-containing protein [Mycolicibacterium confluentis]|uniref:helix-turn-helix domain-containing protein n=1 Tax=Mycolicibacterium confluentis TaxID=28047 RepID=UPI000A15C95C|nr:helix-turn-helix transcriptional regulator [Mycolicibacterium confluentis]MCV7318996.1 helix-turn-helix transcriptional regulator [Mycolicibacterium confluentis]ORV28829.1 transcriptional regulator [Mycolicibacterium confluentis]